MQRFPANEIISLMGTAPRYDLAEIRLALDLDEDVPLVLCDARKQASVKSTLIRLVESIAAGNPSTLTAQGSRLSIGR